jgi:HAD superfamily hydrolase (TIGR01509 family)
MLPNQLAKLHLSEFPKNCQELLARLPFRPKAFTWDMDGTILNSEAIHMKIIMTLLGHPPPWSSIIHESIDHCTGFTDEQVINFFEEKNLITADLNPDPRTNLMIFKKRKHEEFLKLLTSNDPKIVQDLFYPPLIELIKDLFSHGFPMALVTSSEKETTEILLKKVGLYDLFPVIITRQDVTKTKPDPYPYELALKKLNLNPAEVIGFEDSLVGMRALTSSGIYCVGVSWYSDR